MREIKLLILLKKEFFRIKVMYLKKKRKKESGEKLDENNLFRDLENESEAINYELFEK